MRIHLLAIGNRMPDWVNRGYEEYAHRLTQDCQLQLKEIPAGKRGKSANTQRIIEQEGEQLLQAAPKGNRIVTLDVKGAPGPPNSSLNNSVSGCRMVVMSVCLWADLRGSLNSAGKRPTRAGLSLP